MLVAGVFAVVSLMTGTVRLSILPDPPEALNTTDPIESLLADDLATTTTTTSALAYQQGLTPVDVVTALAFTVGIIQV